MAQIKPSRLSPDSTSGENPKYATGVNPLDRLLSGGLPQGQISEIVGPMSSGKTGLLLKILSETTGCGERVAYVDPFHSFDPVLATQSGLILSRFLWIRSRAEATEKRLEQALKAVDILTRSETFYLVALDLENPSNGARSMSQEATIPTWIRSSQSGNSRSTQRIPFNTWFRIKKTLQGKAISVLVLNAKPTAGSAAAVVLGLERRFVKWNSSGNRVNSDHPAQVRLLQGLCSEVRLLRGKRHGRITLHCAV